MFYVVAWYRHGEHGREQTLILLKRKCKDPCERTHRPSDTYIRIYLRTNWPAKMLYRTKLNLVWSRVLLLFTSHHPFAILLRTFVGITYALPGSNVINEQETAANISLAMCSLHRNVGEWVSG